jgi:hypothetical protein
MLQLDSENFTLRSLVPEDAVRDWGDWLADPATAAAVNAVPRSLSVEERRQYIAAMDNKTAYILGIFEKTSGDMIGIWTIYVDPGSQEYLLNVLVGPGDGRNQGALTETREPIYRYFFNEGGMEAARLNVMASNTYVLGRLKKQPWTIEHRSQTTLAGTNDPVEVCHLRMTKQAWQEFHAKKAAG